MKEVITTTELNETLQSNHSPQIFDVRKKPAFDSDPRTISTAQWQQHDAVEQWAKQLSKESPVVVYCVHGHEVSQNVAIGLRELGFDASYLEGGIVTWLEEGFAVS